MTPLIALHAVGASLSLLLGGVNLTRRPKGDHAHRIIGRVWVVAMYWTLLSSLFIRELRPHGSFGGYSVFHALAIFTLVTLSIGLWAAITGRVEAHRGFMRGSWFGVVGAFVGAVAVPTRDIPQLAVHDTAAFVVAVLVLIGTCAGVVLLAVRSPHSGIRTPPSTLPSTLPTTRPTKATNAPSQQ